MISILSVTKGRANFEKNVTLLRDKRVKRVCTSGGKWNNFRTIASDHLCRCVMCGTRVILCILLIISTQLFALKAKRFLLVRANSEYNSLE